MATADLMEVTNASNLFANKFYQIISKTTKGNVFFSPLSAHALLSMVYQGAAKETAECFVKALGTSKELTANGYNQLMIMLNHVDMVTLHIANKIYVKEGFLLKEKFLKVTAELFLSETENINFENSQDAAANINHWAEEKTNSKIKDIVSPNDLDSDTRLILLNAIYFKGDWDQPFRNNDTNTEPFYITSNNKIDCQMMHTTKYYSYGEDEHLDARILEMMYVNHNISMVVILPNRTDGIDDLENKIAGADLSAITQNIDRTRINLSLPKFKIETSMNLQSVLRNMDLGIIFDKNKANLSEISESNEQLHVSQVIQKAFIEVNEKGAEAAAVTKMKIMLKKGKYEPEPITFVVDHPFIILLQTKHENLKITLFYGKIVNPTY